MLQSSPHNTSLSLHSFLLKQVTKMKLHSSSLLTLIHISSLLLVLADSTQPPFSCDTSDPLTKSYPFCKTALSINQRVQDLISRLTLDEKISQLVNSAPAIPRLGIPDYEWWSEALHGVAYLSSVSQGMRFNGTIQSATSFPQVILTAASFDANLWYRIGQARSLSILYLTKVQNSKDKNLSFVFLLFIFQFMITFRQLE